MITFTLSSVLHALRDPHVRAGMYLWLLIAGGFVLVANAFAA